MADEKVYMVPLGKAYDYIRTKRARRAVVIVQQFVVRHSKVKIEDAKLSNALNSALWARGIQKPPRRIKIKVVKEGTVANAYLPDETIKKPETKKESKEDKKVETAKPDLKGGEKKADSKAKSEEKKGQTEGSI